MTAATTHKRAGYMPALDAVKGLALMGVVTYHFNTEWLPGAYWTIDLFFVLSGFLITSLLLKEYQRNDRISLSGFWGRRFRRLMPAALLVLSAVAIWAYFVNDPIVNRQVRGDGLAALGYVLNIKYVITGSSYFEAFLSPSPFRHMWSLSLEEQWYALWPIAMWLILRRGGIAAAKRAVPWLLGLSVVAAVWMAYLVSGATDPSRVYYGSDTRSQALLVGAALGIWLHGRDLDTGIARRRLDVAGSIGAAICIWMIFTASDHDLGWYRGGFLLFSLAAAPWITAVAQPTPGFLHRIFDHQPFRWFGLLTYGIYLWHWPIDVAFKRLEIRGKLPISGVPLFLVQSAITVAVAAACYYGFEVPIRDGRWRLPRPRVLTVAAIGACAVMLVGFTIPRVDNSIRFSALHQDLPKSVAHNGSGGSGATVSGVTQVAPTTTQLDAVSPPSDHPAPDAPPPLAPGKDPSILWVGDSSAWVMAGVLKPPGATYYDGSAPGCGVDPAQIYLGKRLKDREPGCAAWKKRWGAHVGEHPDIIVVSQGFHSTFDQYVNGRRLVVGTPEWKQRYHDALQSGIDVLKPAHSRNVMLTFPCSQWRGTKTAGEEGDLARVEAVNEQIRIVASENPGWVSVVEWASFLCHDGQIVETIDGVDMRPDGAHLLASSAPIAFRWMMPRLLAVAQRPTA